MSIQDEDVAGDIGAVPRCDTCNSERVVKDAWACWNPETGLWELENVFDNAFCHACGRETKLVWSKPEGPKHRRIQELNDTFRMKGEGTGTVAVTSGVQAQGEAFMRETMLAVKEFSDFGEDNDPWGEHDFGAIAIGGEKIFWKLDYYALDLSAASPNPANSAITHRVLTIMLANEY